jgi:hypothetical protein
LRRFNKFFTKTSKFECPLESRQFDSIFFLLTVYGGLMIFSNGPWWYSAMAAIHTPHAYT